MARKKILLLATGLSTIPGTHKSAGADLKQIIYAFHCFEEAHYDLDIVTPAGGALAIDPFTRDIVDPICSDYLEQARFRYLLERTLAAEQVNVSQYEALLCIGGVVALWDFWDCLALIDIRDQFEVICRPIGALGEGVALLAASSPSYPQGIIPNRKVTGMSPEEQVALGLEHLWPYILSEKVENHGGIFTSDTLWRDHTMRDGSLFTGQNTASALTLCSEILSTLRSSS